MASVLSCRRSRPHSICRPDCIPMRLFFAWMARLSALLVKVRAVEREIVAPAEIANAAQPIHVPVGVVGGQADPVVALHVVDSAAVSVAQGVIHAAVELRDLQPGGIGPRRVSQRVAVDRPSGPSLLLTPIDEVADGRLIVLPLARGDLQPEAACHREMGVSLSRWSVVAPLVTPKGTPLPTVRSMHEGFSAW